MSSLKPTQQIVRARQAMIDEVMLMLGHPMIDIELTPQHYELALNLSFDKWRQLSSNSVEERIAVLDLITDQNEYYLPEEVINVRKIFRRGVTGTASGTGAYFDPFGAAFAAQFTIAGLGNAGDLTTYELFRDFESVIGRMFGANLMFMWHPTIHRLDIQRHITGPESVVMWVEIKRTDEMALQDPYSKSWLRDYAVARAKIMLGDIRGKYSSLAGPSGGISLNGDAIKNEGIQESQRLELELKAGVDGTEGYGMIIG